MTELRRNRKLRFGSVEIAVAIPERTARKIPRSRAYKRIFRPLASWGYRRLHGRGASGPDDNRVSQALPSAPPSAEDFDREARRISEKISDVDWYHSIDLGHGVVTPGFVDHRPQLPHYGLPDSMAGLRCLDVATWDGYWAFEMERRRAAEVVALDVASFADCDVPKALLDEVTRTNVSTPLGEGFRVAREVLHSDVRREICNVYDLSPQRFGKFDFVFLSDLLLHLRDPQLALEKVSSVCRGTLTVADVYHPSLEAYGDACLSQFQGSIEALGWWAPNTNTLKMMMKVAGFEPVTEVSRFVLNARSPAAIHKVVLVGVVPERNSSVDSLHALFPERAAAPTSLAV